MGFWKTVAWVAFTPLSAMGVLIAIGYTGLLGTMIYMGILVTSLYKLSHKTKGNLGEDSKISFERQQKAIDKWIMEVQKN